jgi:hypothetical protein
MIGGVDAAAEARIRAWLEALSRESRVRLYLLLDELCSGMDVSRHNEFGFLRLRAEFETSGELFGCSLEELRDAIGRTLGDTAALRPTRPQSPLERLRSRVSARGHPDFR